MDVVASGLLERALGAALREARGPRSAAWLAACAEWEGPHPGPGDDDLDALADQAWRVRGRAGRRELGQVFTPRDVARQVLLETPGAGEGLLLDPSCGGGVFLVEAARLRAEACGDRPRLQVARRILDEVHGVDLDAGACRLARLMVGRFLVRWLGDEAEAADLPLPTVICADATDPAVTARWAGQVRAVVGNPPYREAKGMPAPERERLRARFAVDGAFDLYLCFLVLAERLCGEAGAVGFVLPNKLLVARYAGAVRRDLVARGRLRAIVDLSELAVFGGVGVYPVVVVLGPAVDRYRAVFAVSARAPLGEAPLPGVEVAHRTVRRLVDPPIWFTLPAGPFAGLLERLAGTAPPLSALAEIRSTCSFHARGLRERYVRPGEELPDGLPYLGGRSFARRNEVVPFGVDWQGFRIRYASEELKALGNPLPPLARFLRPKVVLCQHARSGVAWYDAEGRFVTKDVYPIAFARDPHPDATAALAAVLNSRVFSTLYALMYRGIAIGGGYLHFLPAFLGPVPVPSLSAAVSSELAAGVRALQADPRPEGFEALDDRVSGLYELDAAELRAVRAFADQRLGYAEPLARR